VLSYAEHAHNIRPSSFLSAYLFTTILFDIAHARTLWLRVVDNTDITIASLAVAVVIIRLGLAVLEAIEKRRLLDPPYRSCPPEATVSIYDRYFFWWLNPMFIGGFGRILEINDLFQLDKKLGASRCHHLFKAAWAAGELGNTSFLFLDGSNLGTSYQASPYVTVDVLFQSTKMAYPEDHSSTRCGHSPYLLPAIPHQQSNNSVPGSYHQGKHSGWIRADRSILPRLRRHWRK